MLFKIFCIGAVVYSTLSFGFIWTGIVSIKTFSLYDNQFEINYLFGLYKEKIQLIDILDFKFREHYIFFSKSEVMILSRSKGSDLYIKEFDQKGFTEIKEGLSSIIMKTKTEVPFYWSSRYTKMLILIAIWYLIIIAVAVFGG